MAMNGTDVLLLVNIGTELVPDFVAVGSQRGMTRVENVAEIDISSKDEAAKRILGGRYSSTMTLDGLYVPDDEAMLTLKSAVRNRELILVRMSEEGDEVEEASALVTSKSESWPDQGEATISISLSIDGEWTTVGS